MILITGANGLIGRQIAKKITSQGHHVKLLIREKYNTTPHFDTENNLEFIEGDILDVFSLEKAMEDVTFVIHAAAVVSFAPKEKDILYKTNIEGTANVVNICLLKGIKKLLFISSIAALGRPDLNRFGTHEDIRINEDQKWEDSPYNSAYAKSKYGGELEVWRGVAEGLNAVVVNPSMVLGEGDWSRSSTQLFKYVYDQKKFYTDGIMNYVDVEDVADICIKLLFSDIVNERFVLSAGYVSFKDLFDKMAYYFQKTPPKYKVSPFLAEIVWRIEALRSWFTGKAPLITKETARTARGRFIYENTKIKKALNIEFKPLNETLQRVCDKLSK